MSTELARTKQALAIDAAAAWVAAAAAKADLAMAYYDVAVATLQVEERRARLDALNAVAMAKEEAAK